MCDGVGLGHVLLHEPRVVVKQLVAEDLSRELTRLEQAVDAMRASIDELVAHGDRMGAGEHRDVLETVRMVAYDRGWVRRLREAVKSGLTAEAAVERVQSDARARMQRQTDPYLRDRLHDLDDIANRLLHQLTGQSYVADRDSVPENAIIVARTMGPAALLDYDRSRLRGLVLEEGGPSSHVAIVARAIGIATVGLVPGIIDLVETGDPIIIDGSTGEVHVRPQPDVQNAYAEKARLRARRQEQYAKLRDVPAVTKDGVEIALHMNAGLAIDVPHLHETGAASIGLFRTELQFMLAPRFPRMDEQYRFYRGVFDAVPNRPVTFRTLDIGSDKILPYMAKIDEENPALGWRAIRIGLDRPGLLRMQLRAMLKAGAGRDLRIMFPMIANVAEFEAAKAVALRELDTSAPAQLRGAQDAEARRHGGGALAAVGARSHRPARGFSLGRVQRSRAIHVCRGPRQYARLEALRQSLAAGAARAGAHRRRRQARRHAGHALRRDGRTPAGGAGPARGRLSLALHVAVLDRAGQIHDPQSRSRGDAGICGAIAGGP